MHASPSVILLWQHCLLCWRSQHRSGEPQAGRIGGGGAGVVAQMVALVEALSTFSPGLWGSDFEIVDGGFVK